MQAFNMDLVQPLDKIEESQSEESDTNTEDEQESGTGSSGDESHKKELLKIKSDEANHGSPTKLRTKVDKADKTVNIINSK